jgi:hypothetical protein
MAKRRNPTIPPFPSHIDRFRFGDWLSGFVDGEGCFRLACSRNPKLPGAFRSGFAEFQINLRADDRPILELIQSFLGCGRFTVGKRMVNHRRPNPLLMLCVSRTNELHNIVIPLFERHPLHAKESRDFAIWRRGVELLYRVARRPRRAQRGVGCGAGRMASWTAEELSEFTEIMEALRDVRRFDAPPSSEVPAHRRGRVDGQVLLFGP